MSKLEICSRCDDLGWFNKNEFDFPTKQHTCKTQEIKDNE